jgi:hypothetical protein
VWSGRVCGVGACVEWARVCVCARAYGGMHRVCGVDAYLHVCMCASVYMCERVHVCARVVCVCVVCVVCACV